MVDILINDRGRQQATFLKATMKTGGECHIFGDPDEARICTSHIERQNLTMRMQIRRLTRPTNAFSKTVANHRAAIALHFAWYNFCRKHQTIKTPPAVAAGITDHVWSLGELLSNG